MSTTPTTSPGLGRIAAAAGLVLGALCWAALLVAAPVALMLAVGEGRTGSVAGMLVLAAGFAAVAWRLLSLPREQWERAEPLGNTRPRRGVADEPLRAASSV